MKQVSATYAKRKGKNNKGEEAEDEMTKHGKVVHKGKGKGHPCTGTEALYRPYGP